MIAALISQVCGDAILLDSAKAAVFLHGLAGDIALKEKGEMSLVASDVVGKIHAAIMKTTERGE